MEFIPFEKITLEALEDCKGEVKHCAKNAISHLEKAWLVKDIDLEMAMFRSITAEEEAASAFFYCIKNHQYKNSKLIQFKQHTYKLALYPFIQGISVFFDDFLNQDTSPFSERRLKHIDLNGRKAIELLLFIKNQDIVARPTPPLHFSVTSEETGEVCTFEHNFQELIEGKNFTNALKYIKDIANTRNKLLYANSSGRPKLEGNLSRFINNQKKKVMVILTILLMIDPWEKKEGKSMFVQQALDSFLLLLQKINAEEVSQPRLK